MPASTVAGGLILLVFTSATGSGHTTPSGGWALVGTSSAGGASGSTRSTYKLATAGTEGGTTVDVVTAASREACSQAVYYLPSEWGGNITTDVVAGTAVMATPGTNADPPSVAPTWSGQTESVLAMLGLRNDAVGTLVTDYPAGYGSTQTLKSTYTGSNRSVESSLAFLDPASGTQNPGAFTHASANYTANTILIRRGPASQRSALGVGW